MAHWNRLATTLIAVFLVIAAIVTVLAATGATDPDFLPGGEGDEAWFYDQLKGVAAFGGRDEAITIAASIAVAIAMLSLFFVEVSAFRRQDLLLPISSTSEGTANIEESSVKYLAERTGILNPYVNSLRCQLAIRKRQATGGPASIAIECYPRVVLGSDVQEIRDDLQTRIREKVQHLTGLTVSQVHVMRVKFDRGDETRLWALREADE